MVAVGGLSLRRRDGLFLAAELGVFGMVLPSYLEGRPCVPKCDGNLGNAGAVPKLSNGGFLDNLGDFTVVVRSTAPEAGIERNRPWKSPETAANEPMSYRSALAGIVLGVVALVAFLGYAGMSAWVVLLFSSYTSSMQSLSPVFARRLDLPLTMPSSWGPIRCS